MSERGPRRLARRLPRLAGGLRWALLAAAVTALVVFLVAQRQSADVTYGRSPATAVIPEGSAGELTGAELPSVEQMTAMVAAHRVVRLPGAVAQWDATRVAVAIGGEDVRILAAPPGLTDAQRDQVYDVDNATIRVIGDRVSGGIYQVTASTLDEWRGQFARDDITGMLVTLINALEHGDGDSGTPGAASDDSATGGRWREPTGVELATVAADLRASGVHVAPGATLTTVPRADSARAFGAGAVYVALPAQPMGTPAPDYGPALTRLFPDTPIIVMYGDWIEYHGPHAADFADVAAASFYARFGDRLSGYAYPQDNVLAAYLAQVTDVRYAGLFDRPLPYQPFDPLRVALPALPWLFAVCVAAFMALSVRSPLRALAEARHRIAGGQSGGQRAGVPARLAGLTALAVEVSGLGGTLANPALTRAISKLGAAREALDNELPDRHVRALLDDAEAELDRVGRVTGLAAYRPEVYLRGPLA